MNPSPSIQELYQHFQCLVLEKKAAHRCEVLFAHSQYAFRSHLDCIHLVRTSEHLQDLWKLWIQDPFDPSALKKLLLNRYPNALPPKMVHHLASLWTHPADDDAYVENRVRGIWGFLWIWDQWPQYWKDLWKCLPLDLRNNLNLNEVFEHLPLFWLQVEALAFEHFSITALENHSIPLLRAASVLRLLMQTLENLQVQSIIRDFWNHHRQSMAKIFIQQFGERLDQHFHQLENAQIDHLSRFWKPLFNWVEYFDHCEWISTWILKRIQDVLWKLYNQNRYSDLRVLCKSLEIFADDLEMRLQHQQAFGHQHTFAEFITLYAFVQTLEDRKQEYFRRALNILPSHHNAKQGLIRSDIRKIHTLLREFSISPESLSLARSLIDEIKRLNPSHPELKALEKLWASKAPSSFKF